MNIALIGYGKMGKAIEEIAHDHGHKIVLKITSSNQEALTASNIKLADVAIEFTRPEAALSNIMFCVEHDVPVVCGTTGWLDQLETVKDLLEKKNGSFLFASNFSIGVNIFFELNQHLARLMSKQDQFDVSMEETHHIHKKDAPSGTAITLAEAIIGAGKKKTFVGEKTGNAEELTITSIRKDEVAGTHAITYFSDDDQIEIIHTAHNRKGFAAGAVAAAEFIKDRKGMFSMKDVLGL